MIIIGFENCKTCKDFKARHKDYKYIELSESSTRSTGDILQAKILLGRYGIDIFPVVATDNFEEIVSIEEIDPEFKNKHKKLF